jgi:hypothetical protein
LSINLSLSDEMYWSFRSTVIGCTRICSSYTSCTAVLHKAKAQTHCVQNGITHKTMTKNLLLNRAGTNYNTNYNNNNNTDNKSNNYSNNNQNENNNNNNNNNNNE